MSEKQNYDKILLASGIVLGLGVAAYGTLTFLGLNDKYKFTTQVSEKAIEPPPGIKKAAEVGQELSASHELKPIAQETQKYVGFVAPNLWIKEGGMEPFDIISGPPIHGNIPNKWFLDNGLENEFVYSDVLTGTRTTMDLRCRKNMRLKHIPTTPTAILPSSASFLSTKSSSSASIWLSPRRMAMTLPLRA